MKDGQGMVLEGGGPGGQVRAVTITQYVEDNIMYHFNTVLAAFGDGCDVQVSNFKS